MDDLIAQIAARLPDVAMLSDAGRRVPDPAGPLKKPDLDVAKANLGAAPSKLLVKLYRKLGNGGWGPGYGLLGLGGGARDDLGRTADGVYLVMRQIRKRGPRRWPEGLLPICHLGCAMYICLDCETDALLLWEPNLWDERDWFETALFQLDLTLEAWLRNWAAGHPFDLHMDRDTGAVLYPALMAPSDPKHPSAGLSSEQANFLDKL